MGAMMGATMDDMIELEDFLPGILASVTGCPEFTAKDMLRRCAIDFLRRTRLWETTEPFALNARQNTYDLDPPDEDSEILELLAVSFQGRPLRPATEVDLDDRYARWRTEPQPGNPERYAQQAEDTITFVPSDDNVSVAMTYLLIPSTKACTLPSFLYRRWRETIEQGTIARLLMMPNAQWASPQGASTANAVYESGVAAGCKKKARGVQRAPIRTRGYYY